MSDLAHPALSAASAVADEEIAQADGYLPAYREAAPEVESEQDMWLNVPTEDTESDWWL